MALIADGRYEQVGTFNGNPLTMAAARADADRGARRRGVRASRAARGRMRRGHRALIAAHDLPWHVVSGRRQGLRRLPAEPIRDYRDFLDSTTGSATPLAVPAQRRRVPPAVGQGRAVAALGAAHRRRRRPVRRQRRTLAARARRPRRGGSDGRQRAARSRCAAGQAVRTTQSAVDGHRPRRPRPASSSRCSAPRAAARPRRCG